MPQQEQNRLSYSSHLQSESLAEEPQLWQWSQSNCRRWRRLSHAPSAGRGQLCGKTTKSGCTMHLPGLICIRLQNPHRKPGQHLYSMLDVSQIHHLHCLCSLCSERNGNPRKKYRIPIEDLHWNDGKLRISPGGSRKGHTVDWLLCLQDGWEFELLCKETKHIT